MKVAEKLWRGLDRAVDFLMWMVAALMAADVIVVSGDVLLRYAFSITHPWLFELTEYSLLWMTFLGAAWIMRHDGHVRMELVVSRLGPGQARWLHIIGTVLSAGILVVAFWFSLQVTVHDFGQATRLSTVIRPLKWPIEAIIPVGFAFLTVEAIRTGYRRWSGV